MFRSKKNPAQKYRIISHPEWGFCALVDIEHDLHSWLVDAHWFGLKSDGTEGVHEDSCLSERWRDDYWVSTQDEAGARINLHATRSGVKDVWSGG